MDDLPRQKLKLIITNYGFALHEDTKRCEALLRDFCGQYRQEISLLINAQKENIPTELLTSQNSNLPISLTLGRLSKRLEDNLAIKPDAAKWSVESWALALNIIAEAEIVNEKLVSPPPASSPPNYNSEQKNSLPPTVKPHSNQETIQKQQISPDTQNSVLSYPKKQGGILSSTKIRRSVLLISTVLGLILMFYNEFELGYILAGHILIMMSGTCVVFFGRPKCVALWRRIIMWLAGSYFGIGEIVWLIIKIKEGDIVDMYSGFYDEGGAKIIAISYIISIFIGRW